MSFWNQTYGFWLTDTLFSKAQYTENINFFTTLDIIDHFNILLDYSFNVSIQILESTPAKETVKKEQLTKAQKRNAWKKGGLDKGERERGWDWIDVIRHLSQTGSKQE